MAKKKNDIKKYIIFFIGTLIFSFGISFGNRSLFGGNSMAVFVVGISKHINLSISTCNLIVAAFEMAIGYILDKKNVTWASVVAMVVGSYLIDFANLFVLPTEDMLVRFIYMFLGILCYTLGLGIQQYASIGYGNLDCFIFGLKKVFNIKKYHTIKWVVDFVFIIAGYFLGAEVGVGTVLLLAFAGVLIETFKGLCKKVLG